MNRCRRTGRDLFICLTVYRAAIRVIGESGKSFRRALRHNEFQKRKWPEDRWCEKPAVQRSDSDVHDVVVGRDQLVAHLQAELESHADLDG